MTRQLAKQDFIQCFSAGGEPVADLPRGFVSYSTKNFRRFDASPIFHRRGIPTVRELDELAAYLEARPRRREIDTQHPYFNFYEWSRTTTRRIEQVLAKANWQVLPHRVYVNAWVEPEELRVPSGFSIQVGGVDSPRLLDGHFAVLGRCFEAEPRVLRLVRRAIRDLGERCKLVVAYDARDRPVGTGMVAMRGQYAVLAHGCVLPKYRRKGLWRALVASRQVATEALGIRVWFLQTQNPRIARRGQEVRIFRVAAPIPGKPR